MAVEPGSLDLIFCDIPYSRDFAPCWEPLAEFAATNLKEGKHLLLMTGQDCLPDIMRSFSGHLSWVWPLALIYTTKNQAMVHHKKVRAGWKPILWFTRGTYKAEDEIIDTLHCTGQEKEFGDWQQGTEEAQHFLGLLSRPGDLICDPCVGHGTTAVACKRLGGRRFLGCDIRQDRVDDTMRRLAQEG